MAQHAQAYCDPDRSLTRSIHDLSLGQALPQKTPSLPLVMAHSVNANTIPDYDRHITEVLPRILLVLRNPQICGL
jgi:hypothetical protein